MNGNGEEKGPRFRDLARAQRGSEAGDLDTLLTDVRAMRKEIAELKEATAEERSTINGIPHLVKLQIDSMARNVENRWKRMSDQVEDRWEGTRRDVQDHIGRVSSESQTITQKLVEAVMQCRPVMPVIPIAIVVVLTSLMTACTVAALVGR